MSTRDGAALFALHIADAGKNGNCCGESGRIGNFPGPVPLASRRLVSQQNRHLAFPRLTKTAARMWIRYSGRIGNRHSGKNGNRLCLDSTNPTTKKAIEQ